MGSSDLYDIVKFFRLFSESISEFFKVWNKSLVGFDDSGDMHNSWESIV